MVYIVLPAYNEAGKISAVIRGIQQAGFSDIIVVDDGSSDATGELARSVGALVLRHRINRGQGAALETGNEYARRNGACTVVHFDSDGQFLAADIAPALAFAQKNNLDVVLGSRFLDNRSQLPWSKRYIILPLARALNTHLTGIKLTDAHNGFRILRGRALREIKISYDGMAHNSEIVSAIAQYGLRYAEFPVAVSYSRYGQGITGGVKTVRDLLIAPWLK